MLSESLDRNVEQLRAIPRTADGSAIFVGLLRQDAPHFHGLSTSDAQRLRGHILAELQDREHLPDLRAAILEDLQTSRSPVVLAGAARALRGEAPDAVLMPWLAASIERIALIDEYVVFGRDRAEGKTARAELAETLEIWNVAPPSCCSGAKMGSAPKASGADTSTRKLCPSSLCSVELEDQDGAVVSLIPLLRERPTIIGFFYTRCMNPEKCSLTIMRLGILAKQLGIETSNDWNVLAISYDPNYDTPRRLRTYGQGRNFPFGVRTRISRCINEWRKVQQAFDLRVGYSAATVNEHARECFLVSADLHATGLDANMLADPSYLADWRSRMGVQAGVPS